MLLEYKTVDRYLLASLSSCILHHHPEVSFAWMPIMSTLCVFCPDLQTAGSVAQSVRAELNVEPSNTVAA